MASNVDPIPLPPLPKDATIEQVIEAYNKLLSQINQNVIRQIRDYINSAS